MAGVRSFTPRCNPAPGERHGMSKLTEADVRAIRMAAPAHGTRGATALARSYGVRKYTIQLIFLGETWKHLLAEAA